MQTIVELSNLFQILDQYAGVGLWDAVLHEGELAHPRSRWRWSSEFRRLLGYERKADFPDLFSSWVNALHPEDVEQTFIVIDAVIKSPQATARYDTKFRLRNADGRYRWYRALGGLKHDPSGVATHACGTLIDIDDAERAFAAAARRTEEELKRLKRISSDLRIIAINARIEASRFGGKGAPFSVVAGEISTLASAIAASVEEISKK